tara:strand:- start:166 stop:1194 length:1029 start_codon:yes stop_codon:yes gene_type:complete
MKEDKLIILSNEKVFREKKLDQYSCLNADLQILPDELNKFYNVECIFRKLKDKGNHKYNFKKIKASGNIFVFILNLLRTFKTKKSKYLIISISPYTFISFLFLFFFKKNIFTYLMSDGHEEYKYILGNWSVWIYDLMFKILTKNSKVIVCHERLFDKDKSFLIDPSRLSEVWMSNHTIPKKDIPRLLYVGRINPEKGIENFINIFNKLKIKAELSIVGESRKKNSFLNSKNIKLLGYVSQERNLVDIYDGHNITILPSYTEAYPYVIEESLSRRRPVIIFKDIDYVKKNKLGIFISKRDVDSVTKTINHILENYYNIQKDIEKNKLPTKKDMIQRFVQILNN